MSYGVFFFFNFQMHLGLVKKLIIEKNMVKLVVDDLVSICEPAIMVHFCNVLYSVFSILFLCFTN